MENATPSQEIAVVEQNQQIAALGNDKPEDVVARATNIANVLAPIIQQRELYKSISGKNHIMAEGWATLMGLLNVDPIVEYCRRVDRGDEIAYEAKVNLVKNGRIISSAETIASDKEKASWSRSEQGIKSMAQTRAFGKACRLKYSWIIVMAGYSPTPAEEMDTFDRPSVQVPQPKPRQEAPIEFSDAPAEVKQEYKQNLDKPITKKQQAFLFARWRAAGFEAQDLKKHLMSAYNLEHTDALTRWQLDEIIAICEKEGKR